MEQFNSVLALLALCTAEAVFQKKQLIFTPFCGLQPEILGQGQCGP